MSYKTLELPKQDVIALLGESFSFESALPYANGVLQTDDVLDIFAQCSNTDLIDAYAEAQLGELALLDLDNETFVAIIDNLH